MSRVAIVTGSSSELGANVIEGLLRKGHKVYALSRSKEGIKLEDKMLSKIEFEITNSESCKKAIKQITKKSGSVDILINIVGVTVTGKTLDYESEDLAKTLEVNVVGMFNVIKHLVENNNSNRLVNIINITSMAGIVAFPNFGIYSASKFAQEALGMSLAYELDKYNIKVTNIAPGAIQKKVLSKDTQKRRSAREKFTLIKWLMPIVSSKKVSEIIVETAENTNPPKRILVGRDAKTMYYLQKLLPFSVFSRLMLYVWNKR